MIRQRSNWFFPLCLAVVLGGVTFWLDKITDIQTVEIPLNPNEPQYEASGVAGERFNEQGQRWQTVSARRAWQFPKQQTVHFDHPDISLYDNGSALYRLTADNGLYHDNNKTIDFSGNVVWTKNARANEPAARLTTSSLHVDTRTQTVQTDAPIAYSYGDSHGTATGFVYNRERGFLNLHSRIKAIIYGNPKP